MSLHKPNFCESKFSLLWCISSRTWKLCVSSRIQIKVFRGKENLAAQTWRRKSAGIWLNFKKKDSARSAHWHRHWLWKNIKSVLNHLFCFGRLRRRKKTLSINGRRQSDGRKGPTGRPIRDEMSLAPPRWAPTGKWRNFARGGISRRNKGKSPVPKENVSWAPGEAVGKSEATALSKFVARHQKRCG